MAAPTKNDKSYSIFFFSCFCVTLLGSQIVLIYNVYTLTAEIGKLDHWMRYIIENLNYTSSLNLGTTFSEDTYTQDGSSHYLPETNKDYQNAILRNLEPKTNVAQNFSCDIRDPEVLSAIARAETDSCKRQLAEVSCRDQEGKLIPAEIPRLCPIKGGYEPGKYLGCFRDNQAQRDVGNVVFTLRADNSPQRCLEMCINGGYACAALQFSVECWCGFWYGRYGQLPESACSLSCPGNKSQSCGGYNAIRVFSTGLVPVNRFRDVGLVRHPEEIKRRKPIRIVFALMITGRAVRQVKRLIKALYHRDHYYYIHVDKKQRYMYEELLKLEAVLPNVRLARDRTFCLWGGATLLKANFAMMKELLEMKDWVWDYYINLSECAYPIKPVDILATFLRKYQGANFIKSHEDETYKFIDTQGLRQLFDECDNYVWRLGFKKKLPSGIMYDGGSDWFGLHRDFCKYAVYSNDSLVTGLRRYADYSFSPLESFFHTLLINSKFCDKQIDINLSMINWRGPSGCSCAKKRIDGCGCSPKNMKSDDFNAVLGQTHHPVFFARKFEAIVDQDIYNLLDRHLGIHYPEDPKLTLYWQNEYHHLDGPASQTNAFLAFANSFVRRATETFEENKQECDFLDFKLKETHVLFEDNKLQSYLVKHSLLMPDESECTYESRYTKINQLKSKNSSPFNGRLQTLTVGSDYDSKERIFRNYPGFFGPDTKIVLHHSWIYGPGRKVTFVWIDSAGKVAALHHIRIARTHLVQRHNPKLKGPLRPGIWTTKVLIGQREIARVKFLIIPVESKQGGFSSDDKGPAEKYPRNDFVSSHGTHDKRYNDRTGTDSDVNHEGRVVDFLGEVDKLTARFWTLRETCLISLDKSCLEMPSCLSTEWSSLSPDPKSDIYK